MFWIGNYIILYYSKMAPKMAKKYLSRGGTSHMPRDVIFKFLIMLYQGEWVLINADTRERTSREDRLIGRNIPKEHRLPPVQTWRAQNMFALLSNLQQPSSIQVNSS